MGKKVDPRDFLLNTDYEMDKIIYFTEFNRTISSSTTITIPHGLKTIPLVFGMWSNNADYSNSHELGAQTAFSGNITPCYVTADYNNVNVTLAPQSGNTNFYVRVFGFEPNYSNTGIEFQHKKLATTNKYARKFILNTDYNYLKLLKSGNFLEWDTSRYCHAYKHNLGYLPQVLNWASIGGDTIEDFDPFYPTASFSYSDNSSYNSKGGLFVTDIEILRYDGVVPLQHDIRLYSDEA